MNEENNEFVNKSDDEEYAGRMKTASLPPVFLGFLLLSALIVLIGWIWGL